MPASHTTFHADGVLARNSRKDFAAIPAPVETRQDGRQPTKTFAHHAVLAAVIRTGEAPGLGTAEQVGGLRFPPYLFCSVVLVDFGKSHSDSN